MKNKISTQRGSFTRTIKLFFLTFIALLAFSSNADATHFRYNSMSWSMGTNDTVIFKVRQAWRATFFGGVALGNQVFVGSMSLGDGNTQNLNLTVQTINTTDDWFEGEITFKHKYATAGTYVAQFFNCCRISSLLQNNGDQNYDIRTSVTVGGVVNNSPISSVPPIVSFQLNSPNTFLIPGFDPDGDAISYTITPAGQSGLFTPQPTGLTLSSAGLISWTPTVSGLYALSVRVTDSKGDYVTIDFLLRVSASTSNPPVYNYAVTPANNFVYSVLPGTPINFNVEANDVDAGSQVTLIATGTPAGAAFTPLLPIVNNPVMTSFSWTPTFANVGSYIVSFTATDNNGQQATTNVVINVNTNPVFDVPPTPPLGFEYCLLTGNAYSFPVQAQNTLSAVNTSIVSMSGLPASATTTPALPTASAAFAATTLNWTPSPSEWGPHTVVFTATDLNAQSTNHNFKFVVNTSPYFTSPMPSSSATVGVLYTHAFSGADLNVPYGDVLEFHDLNVPSFLTLVDNGNGTATLSGTPSLSDVGTYTFEIILEDIYHHCGPEVSQTVTLTVSASACNIVVTAPAVAKCASGSPITLLGTPAGGTWDLPNPYTGNATSYTYTYTDGNGCTGTATGNIVPASVTPAVIQTPIAANTTTATITWAPVPGTTKYYLWYKPVSAPSNAWLTPTFTSSNSFTLSNLIPGTLYEVKIRNNNEICGLYGNFGAPVQFTTGTEPCGFSTTVSATEVPVKKISFTWAALPGVAQYSLWYRLLPSGSWVTSTLGAGVTNFTTASLPNGTYEYKIRNRCATAITFTQFGPSQTITIGATNKGAMEEQLASAITMFPNPTSDVLMVELNSDKASIVSIKIYDVTGRLMKVVSGNAQKGLNKFEVSLKELALGVYIVQAHENGQLKVVNRVRKQD